MILVTQSNIEPRYANKCEVGVSWSKRTPSNPRNPLRLTAAHRGSPRHTAAQRGSARLSAAQRGTARLSAAQSAAHRDIARLSAAQRGTARHSAAQRGSPRHSASCFVDLFSLAQGSARRAAWGRCPPALRSPSRRGVAAPRGARGRGARGRAAAGALLPRYRPLTYRGRPERWAGVWAGGVKGVVR